MKPSTVNVQVHCVEIIIICYYCYFLYSVFYEHETKHGYITLIIVPVTIYDLACCACIKLWINKSFPASLQFSLLVNHPESEQHIF